MEPPLRTGHTPAARRHQRRTRTPTRNRNTNERDARPWAADTRRIARRREGPIMPRGTNNGQQRPGLLGVEEAVEIDGFAREDVEQIDRVGLRQKGLHGLGTLAVEGLAGHPLHRVEVKAT